MLSSDEFAKIVDLFLEELSGIVSRDSRKVVETNLPLRAEVDEALKLLRSSKAKREEVVTTSFGIVSEFVQARREGILDELYREYIAGQART
jgi:hypothetical protein